MIRRPPRSTRTDTSVPKRRSSDLRMSRLDGREMICRLWDMGVDRPKIGRHTSELQSLMRISYAVFCLKNKNKIVIAQLCTPDHHDHNKNTIVTNTQNESSR